MSAFSSDPPVDDMQAERKRPDRLYYATGVFLEAVDMRAEQLYHRAQLSRALAYLHGCGTVAGLKVEMQEKTIAGSTEKAKDHLIVHPGLAIDRLGRLIEVTRPVCIRFGDWFQQHDAGDLARGVNDGRILIDVFIRFHECEHGKTPAMAAGPFDALDAVTPSRIRDHFRVDLIVRRTLAPRLPKHPWAALMKKKAPVKDVHNAILDSWPGFRDQWEGDQKNLTPLPWHQREQDPTSLFLARIRVPATSGAGESDRPTMNDIETVTIDNEKRLFVYPTPLLTRWLGWID